VKKPSTLAQGITEYALILALVALVVLLVVALFGRQIAAAYQKTSDGFRSTAAAASTPGVAAVTATPAPVTASIQEIALDFMQRALKYYQANGKWPPTKGDERFTALGLDPADWQGPVSGIVWDPDGSDIGLANVAGDNLQVYVTDVKGKQLQLYDGWSIWCHADNGKCYFHNKGVGQEVELGSVVVNEK
jgi:Flp pilus assembly pilin Flp